MFVSRRFRDIFSGEAIATRRGDARGRTSPRETITDAEFERRADELEVDLIWLDIAEAHRRAARAFTPTHNLATDLAE